MLAESLQGRTLKSRGQLVQGSITITVLRSMECCHNGLTLTSESSHPGMWSPASKNVLPLLILPDSSTASGGWPIWAVPILSEPISLVELWHDQNKRSFWALQIQAGNRKGRKDVEGNKHPANVPGVRISNGESFFAQEESSSVLGCLLWKTEGSSINKEQQRPCNECLLCTWHYAKHLTFSTSFTHFSNSVKLVLTLFPFYTWQIKA